MNISAEDIGRNLAELRKRAGLSMDDLANEMRKRGYNWNRTIIFNIEHAERQLKLGEATDILDSLGLSPVRDMERLLAGRKENEISTLILQINSRIAAIAQEYNRISDYRRDLKKILNGLSEEDISVLPLDDDEIETTGEEAVKEREELFELYKSGIRDALDRSSDENLLSVVKQIAERWNKKHGDIQPLP